MKTRARPAGPPAATVRSSGVGRSSTREPIHGREVRAHGSFDDKRHARSAELWISTHSGPLAGTAAGLAGRTSSP